MNLSAATFFPSSNSLYNLSVKRSVLSSRWQESHCRNECTEAQELASKIESVAAMDENQLEERWEESIQTILDGAAFAQENKSDSMTIAFMHLFEKIPDAHLDKLIKTLAFNSLKEGNAYLSTFCLSYVTHQRIEEMLKNKEDQDFQSIEKLAEVLAKNLPNAPETSKSKSFWVEVKRIFSFIINFIPNIINTFLIAFSLFDIGKQPQSAWEASALLDVYYKFIMIPAAIVVAIGVVCPALGWPVYAISAAVVLLGIIALVVYIKWIRPCPNSLPHCHNLTEDAKVGVLTPVIGREEEIQKLVSLFTSLDDNVSRHAILVGPSGVGKTEIVRGLAQKIANGDVPKQLKKKKIFVINTASLVQGGLYGYADQMNFLLNRVKGYEKEVVFFFDEIHVALKDRSCLSDFLKPLLDRGQIHCIAATTTQEYDKYIKGVGENHGDPAFARRFERINVSDMNDDDTKRVLQTLASDSSQGVQVDDSALDHIVKKTNALVTETLDSNQKRHQPAFAVEVLTQAIKDVAASYEHSFTPPDLSEKKSRLESLRKRMSDHSSNFRPYTPEGREVLQDIQSLESEIEHLQAESAEKKRKVEQVKTLLVFQKHRHELLGNTAKKALTEKGRYKVIALKRFFYEVEYLLPELQKMIDLLKNEINDKDFKVAVDEQLVEKIIEGMINASEDESF